MSRRAHGRRRGFEIDAIAQTGFVNAREALANEPAGKMSEIEKDRGVARRAQFGHDRAGDNIAGGEFLERVITLHKTFALCIAQVAAFATQRFAEEKAGRTGKIQRSGVELHKFDVLDRGAGAEGARYAVASGNVGIGSVLENMSKPAGRKQHSTRFDSNVLPAGFFEGKHAEHLAIAHEQIRYG